MKRIETETEAPAAPECRDLVVPGAAAASPVERPIPHPSAAFVTQLLAVRAGLPQTRERRRADPEEATHRYELTMSPRPLRNGRMLSRAM
jgi:hypothetical protein